jgi:16S rRNA processing protein RimM
VLPKNLFELGRIVRKHGFKGGLVIKLDTDQPKRYEKLESVYLSHEGTLIPFFISKSQVLPSGDLRVQFEDIHTEAEAEALLGAVVCLPAEVLPPLSGKQFYFHEVIGFVAHDHLHGDIGTVSNVMERPPQPVFVIETPEGKEIMIPAVDNFIDRIDRDEKIVYLHAPEGLIDLYL